MEKSRWHHVVEEPGVQTSSGTTFPHHFLFLSIVDSRQVALGFFYHFISHRKVKLCFPLTERQVLNYLARWHSCNQSLCAREMQSFELLGQIKIQSQKSQSKCLILGLGNRWVVDHITSVYVCEALGFKLKTVRRKTSKPIPEARW